MDDIRSESGDKDDDNPSNEMEINRASPVQTNAVEFTTPESDRKRKKEKFLHAELDMQKSPDVASDSPSSVLNPPPSLKRRTIRDYFLALS